MAKKMLDENEAKALLAGKPSAKGKKRRTEIEADAELEGRMTEAQTKTQKPKHDDVDPKAVRGGGLRGVMQETFARVYGEIWPGMHVHDERGEVELEIKEEAYILGLTMSVGNDDDKPRKGLKMREVDGLGDSAPYCLEHAA